jgi:hypothetical protein
MSVYQITNPNSVNIQLSKIYKAGSQKNLATLSVA